MTSAVSDKHFGHWLLWIAGISVLAYMGWNLLFSEHGYLVYQQEQVQLEQLQQQLQQSKSEREQLASEVLRLRNNPEALEELIHRELGYVHPDEFMLIMPEHSTAKH